MNVYLVGFMAAGKTTVGERLAAELDWAFVDLDREIEILAQASVEEIFAGRGEAGFRRLERQALSRTLDLDAAVVATGGGVLSAPGNRELMRRGGLCVWLEPSLEVLLDRLRQGALPRPMYRDRARAARLYESRLAGYRTADLRLGVGAGETPGEIADRVAHLLRDKACAT